MKFKLGDTIRYKNREWDQEYRVVKIKDDTMYFIETKRKEGVSPSTLCMAYGALNNFEIVRQSKYEFKENDKIILCGMWFDDEKKCLRYNKFSAKVFSRKNSEIIMFEFDEQHFDRYFISLDEMLRTIDEYQDYIIGFPEDIEIMKRTYVGKINDDITALQEQIDDKFSELTCIAVNAMEEA